MSPPQPPEPEPEVLSTFRLWQDSATIGHGGEIQLVTTGRNQRGFVMVVASPITYAVNPSQIASVSRTGLLTGTAPGTAVISVTTTVGLVTHIDSMTITVRAMPVLDSLILSAESYGWKPDLAHVVAGGPVEWRPGRISNAAFPVSMVYLMTREGLIVDSLDVSRGPARRVFSSPSMIRFCSNACWDSNEWGIVYVH